MEYTKYLDTGFDDLLKATPLIKWLPWIGNNYKHSNLMILGESQYEDGDFWQENNSDATRTLIGVRFSGDIGKLYKNTEKVILSKKSPTIEEGNHIWKSVIYHNLVQRLMNSIKERPNHLDYDNGWKTFFHLVDIFKPSVCISLGKSSCGRLGHYLNNNDTKWKRNVSEFYSNDKIINLSSEEGELKIIFINHPSGSRGFNFQRWADLIHVHEPNLQKLLSLSY